MDWDLEYFALLNKFMNGFIYWPEIENVIAIIKWLKIVNLFLYIFIFVNG